MRKYSFSYGVKPFRLFSCMFFLLYKYYSGDAKLYNKINTMKKDLKASKRTPKESPNNPKPSFKKNPG